MKQLKITASVTVLALVTWCSAFQRWPWKRRLLTAQFEGDDRKLQCARQQGAGNFGRQINEDATEVDYELAYALESTVMIVKSLRSCCT